MHTVRILAISVATATSRSCVAELRPTGKLLSASHTGGDRELCAADAEADCSGMRLANGAMLGRACSST